MIRRRTPAEPQKHPLTRKAAERTRKLGTGDILTWADVAGAGIARGLSEYGKSQRPEELEEVYRAVLTLQGCLETLRERVAPSPA